MPSATPPLIGNGSAGDTVSVSERVTSALLAIDCALGDDKCPDTEKAIAIAYGLKLYFSGIEIRKAYEFPSTLGLPKWLVDQFQDKYALKILDACDGCNPLSKIVSEFVDVLEKVLSNASRCPKIAPATLPRAYVLAAYSAGEEVPMDIGISALNRAQSNRLSRVDIPVIYDAKDAKGALCAGTLKFESGSLPQVKRPSFLKTDQQADKQIALQSFSDGIHNGFNAAVKLLKKLGCTPNGQPVLYLRNIEPPSVVKGGSVALPIAIETLRRTLGLPHPLCVVSGEINSSGKVQPIDTDRPDHAIAKFQAVLDEGSFDRLVAVTKEHHELRGLDTIVAEYATLEDIAHRLWPDAFEKELKKSANEILKKLDLTDGWPLESVPDGEVIVVKTNKADELENHLLCEHQPAAFHIGGPVRSGKTWLAYDVTARLIQHDWDVHVIHSTGEQTSVEALIEGLRMISDLMDDKKQRLIVLDNIRYSDELQNFLLDVGTLPSALRADILVVRQSDHSTDWSKPSGVDIQSIFTPTDLQEFIRCLACQFSSVLKARGTTPETFREDYAGTFKDGMPQYGPTKDLYWICQNAQSGLDLHGYRRYLMEGIRDNERTELERLAYATLYGIGCEVVLIEHLSVKTRDRFRIGTSADGLARIRQSLDAQMVLWDPESKNKNPTHYVEQELGARAILPILKHVVTRSRDIKRLSFIVRQLARSWTTTLKLIFRGKRVDRLREPPLLSKGEDSMNVLLADDFAETPWDAAQLVLDLSETIPRKERLILLKNMARLLQIEVSFRNPRFTCTELDLCYQAVAQYQLEFFEEPQTTGDGDQELCIFGLQKDLKTYWSEFLDKCSRIELAKVTCNRESNPKKRVQLIKTMLRPHMPDVVMDVAVAIPTLKNGLGNMDGRKYRYLYDVRRSITRTKWNIEENMRALSDDRWNESIDEEYGVLAKDFEEISRNECDAVRKNKQTLESLEDFAGWMILMLDIFGYNFNRDQQFITDIFEELAQRATPREIINAIGDIYHQNVPAATNIVKESQLFHNKSLLSRDRGASLTDISDLLFGLERWNINVLQSYLWYSSGTNPDIPNEVLAKELAARVREEGDLRNCGRILRAVGTFDLLFAPDISQGFAAKFLENIGIEWLSKRMDGEVRSAFLNHLVLGLAQIEHPWLEELRDVLVAHLRDSIADRRFQQWAARLFATLLSDKVAAKIFAERLLAENTFDANDIQDGMKNAAKVEALEAYHILGRMLPEIGKDFVKRNDPVKMAQDLGEMLDDARRGEDTLRIIKAVGNTYRQFNPIKANKFVSSFSWNSLRTALRNAKFGSTADALSILAVLNHEKTVELIRRDAGQDILGYKLNLALYAPQAAAEILYTCEKVSKGLGRNLLEKKGQKYREILVSQVRGIQNPRTYATIANMLETVQPDIGNHTATFFKVWIPQLSQLRSPATLVEILKLLKNSYDQGKSKALPRAAESVDACAISVRLKNRRAQEDLSFAPSLAMLLAEAGSPDRGRVIAEALAEVDQLEIFLDESRFVDVLSLFHVLDEDVPRHLFVCFEKHLIESGNKTWLIDPVGFWSAFGAFALARMKITGQKWLAFSEQPPTLPDQVGPANRVLALSAHVEARWVKRIVDDAWREIADLPEAIPREMRPLLYELCTDNEIAGKLDDYLPGKDDLLQIHPFSLAQSEHLATLGATCSDLQS